MVLASCGKHTLATKVCQASVGFTKTRRLGCVMLLGSEDPSGLKTTLVRALSYGNP